MGAEINHVGVLPNKGVGGEGDALTQFQGQQNPIILDSVHTLDPTTSQKKKYLEISSLDTREHPLS